MKNTILILGAMLLAILPINAQKNNQSKTLVAYFSATGTTRQAAAKLAKEHKAVLWEIEAMEPYTAADLDWRNKQSRSSLEMQDEEARPAIKQCTNIMPYDTVYIGYPIWWGICPRISSGRLAPSADSLNRSKAPLNSVAAVRILGLF